jgi:hypothetical protein
MQCGRWSTKILTVYRERKIERDAEAVHGADFRGPGVGEKLM